MRAKLKIVLAALVLAAGVPASASAIAGAQAHLSFDPSRLGASTTITIAFQVGQARQTALSPLTGVELRLPAGVSAGSSGLGVATCTAATLQLQGPSGCSANALMGRGSATVAVPLGARTLVERAAMEIFMAPPVEERTTMLFYATGTNPVISQLVFQGTLLGDSAPFGARLDTTIPPVAGLPDGPDAAVISMRNEIGPKGLEYYKHVDGAVVAYSPEGFDLPRSCPRGGFPFAALFTFADGDKEATTSRTPCPTRG
jgi:hypothetical protein